MQTNNAILFTFGMVFLLLGFLSPMINRTFSTDVNEYDTDVLEELGQGDYTLDSWMLVVAGIFFWTFGAPWWLNIVIVLMRVTFLVIVIDKFRGVSS